MFFSCGQSRTAGELRRGTDPGRLKAFNGNVKRISGRFLETKDVNWPKVSDAKLSRQSLINLTAWYCCFLSDDEGFC